MSNTVIDSGYVTTSFDPQFDAMLYAAQRVSDTQMFAQAYGEADGFYWPNDVEWEYYTDLYSYTSARYLALNYWVR